MVLKGKANSVEHMYLVMQTACNMHANADDRQHDRKTLMHPNEKIPIHGRAILSMRSRETFHSCIK